MIIDHTSDTGVIVSVNREPWRCELCKQLMYNLNAEGYPAPGAPIQLGIIGGPQPICSLCAEMHNAADTYYFRELDKQRKARAEQAKKGL